MIFVGGIHGVGKGYFCNKIAELFNISHYTASDLISLKSHNKLSKNKKVHNAEKNQFLLLLAIKELSLKNTPFLLDGHFSLLNHKNEITDVPIKTFQELKPLTIIVLENKIETIQGNLKKRDGKVYERKLLGDFQTREKTYSREIANLLDIPYKNCDLSKPLFEIENFLIEDLKKFN
ncbi:ATP-binding protein [Salibacterium halotolerans]|uniref:Adenylate kinase n=1 Tax=Salibacterium halotolerans TaxID=1884432 RepID=A0A1I5N904_9BACI|nr:ATP-binding protein [Salibacterium halotolerans]SFP18213.1 adenylate kinase [Salibacterium halotolerans]